MDYPTRTELRHRLGAPPLNLEDEYKPRTLRASSREPSRSRTPTTTTTARNRRRSISNIAHMDNIKFQTASRHVRSRSQSIIAASSSPSSSSSEGDMKTMMSTAAIIITDTEADTILPTISPSAPSAYEAYSPDRAYQPGRPKSLAGIALRAFCLGAGLAVGILGTISVWLLLPPSSSWLSPLWRLPFFLTALSTFHFLEFWTTAAYNTREAEVSSFLLTANGPAYAIAHTAASLECLVTNVFFPTRAWAPFHSTWLLTALGLSLVVIGQVVRTAAMVQAGPSFNHVVQQTQKREHILVTTGIYGKLRHPSYFGFFWWGLGTQLVLGNVVCFVGYAAVLWRFFSTRVKHEELFLVRFFGEEYVDYRKRVGTKIPFVP